METEPEVSLQTEELGWVYLSSGRVHLTQTSPQPIVIKHEQLTEKIPVYRI